MVETLETLEDEIRASLLSEGKGEMVIGGLKISINEEGQIEVRELPSVNLKQLDLPFKPENLTKEDNHETARANGRVGKAEAAQMGSKDRIVSTGDDPRR